MEEIPTDIQKAAWAAWDSTRPMSISADQVSVIAAAIYAERQRCAQIAEQADIDNATALWVKAEILSPSTRGE